MSATPPLDGVRVVDLTWNLPGPYATHLLAALGADVIKVEPPRGDPARAQRRLFESLNRGKRGVVLNLQTEEGRASLRELVSEADVVVEGFRPGVADRLGCSAAQLRAVKPSLVYCSISAYGQNGPRVQEPGHDLNAQALGGAAWLGRDPRGRPRGLPLPIADLSASMSAVASICAALYRKERTGEGSELDVAMLDTVFHWSFLWSSGVDLAGAARRQLPSGGRALAGRMLERLDRERLRTLPHYATYRCRDGGWIALGIVDERKFWTALCAELGLSRLATWSIPARALWGPLLKPLFAIALRRRTQAEWLERLGAAGLPVTPVLTPEQAAGDRHVAERLVGPEAQLRAPLAGADFVSGDVPPAPGDALS